MLYFCTFESYRPWRNKKSHFWYDGKTVLFLNSFVYYFLNPIWFCWGIFWNLRKCTPLWLDILFDLSHQIFYNLHQFGKYWDYNKWEISMGVYFPNNSFLEHRGIYNNFPGWFGKIGHFTKYCHYLSPITPKFALFFL